MKIYYSNTGQNPKNSYYPYMVEIKSREEFINVVKHDHTCAKFKDNYRKNDNFIEADCSMFDVDNTHSENPADWITPLDIQKKFPDVAFFMCYSRNHMIEKNGKAARPKFHIYFVDKLFTDSTEYSMHKQAVCNYCSEFDPNAKDAARFFFGVENPKVELFEGNTLLSDFMASVSVDSIMIEPSAEIKKENKSVLKDKSVIPEGSRNNTLLSYATSSLKRHGDTNNTAHNLYIKRSECCSPPLDEDEIQRIWNSALKFYKKYIKTAPDYIDPKEYDPTSSLIDSTEKEFELQVRDRDIFKSMMIMKEYSKKVNIKLIRMFLITFNIKLRYNNMTHKTEIDGLPETFQGEEEFKLLYTLATDILCNMGFNKPTQLSNIFDLLAHENCYHPAIERITSEEWDGIDRLSEIYNILGIDDDFSKILVKKWSIQAIALLFNDNKKPFAAQGVLVLQGYQGAGKTEFFRHLAIDNSFFKEGAVVDVTNKDTRIATTSCWICEVGELDSTTEKKQSALKSFLTAATDEYRVPYDKHPVQRTRRTSFCGTVNPKGFLTDETGNRRFWTVAINRIDKKKLFSYSQEWYTQFWRQILCEYIDNQKSYLLTPQESDLLNKRNEQHENDVFGEDEFLSMFNITAPKSTWSKRTASEISNLLNKKYQRLNMNASKLGKTLLPKLERRFNVSFDKKYAGGKQYRLFPPRFYDEKSDSHDFVEGYRLNPFDSENKVQNNGISDDDNIEF